MTQKVRTFAIANSDDAGVFWRIDRRIPGCWGFAIERERKLADGSVHRDVLHNRTGFAKDKPRPSEHRPSTDWPFQRFNWTDHSVDQGDVARYRVTPMIIKEGRLSQDIAAQSSWTEWKKLTPDAGGGVSVYFNRGLVISQFMTRYLDRIREKAGLATLPEALDEFKASLGDHELPIRRFLSGDLRLQMLKLLADAKNQKRHIWAALYELADDELVAALEALGKHGHVVLANGSVERQKGVPAGTLRREDQNKSARKRLVDAGLEVVNRMISPGALGHNKFVVVTDAKRKPLAAWTGSTNWTKTGLCTQVNNGLQVENRDFASLYLDQWDLLKAAKSNFPDELVSSNSKRKTVKLTAGAKATVWFTRVRKSVDLEDIESVIAGAKDSILFLMFQPGGQGPLTSIAKRVGQKGMYIKGVVSTFPQAAKAKKNAPPDDPGSVTVTVFGDGKRHPALALDIVQPQGIRQPFSSWAATVSRGDFLYGAHKVGFAIVHSKIILVDPFTNPTLITGSHNFSGAASTKNDENFVIVRGHEQLAMHYAAHILSVYQHYRWLSVVYDQQRRGRRVAPPLVDDDGWQDRHLTGPRKREMNFWVR